MTGQRSRASSACGAWNLAAGLQPFVCCVLLLGACASPSTTGPNALGEVQAPGREVIGLQSPDLPPAGPARTVGSAAFAAAVELGEQYSDQLGDWADLFDQVFRSVSEPSLGHSLDLDAALHARMTGYREGLLLLPQTPVTQEVTETEKGALDFLDGAYRGAASLTESPSPEELSPLVKLMIQAGAAHEKARAVASRYLASLGLDYGV